MSTTLFIQQLVTGLSIGGIYALLAVGYALIYSIFKFTNFAFGAIMMCAAYGAYFMVHELGMTSLLSGLCGAIVVGVLVSVATEIVAYRSLRKMKASRLFLMISAMGVNILIQNFMTIMMSATPVAPESAATAPPPGAGAFEARRSEKSPSVKSIIFLSFASMMSS